jgi:hypothetical protein
MHGEVYGVKCVLHRPNRRRCPLIAGRKGKSFKNFFANLLHRVLAGGTLFTESTTIRCQVEEEEAETIKE